VAKPVGRVNTDIDNVFDSQTSSKRYGHTSEEMNAF